MFADEDDVIVHTHGIREPEQRGAAIVDIFNEDGKIIEHRDVMQQIPENAANPNGMLQRRRRRSLCQHDGAAAHPASATLLGSLEPSADAF